MQRRLLQVRVILVADRPTEGNISKQYESGFYSKWCDTLQRMFTLLLDKVNTALRQGEMLYYMCIITSWYIK